MCGGTERDEVSSAWRGKAGPDYATAFPSRLLWASRAERGSKRASPRECLTVRTEPDSLVVISCVPNSLEGGHRFVTRARLPSARPSLSVCMGLSVHPFATLRATG